MRKILIILLVLSACASTSGSGNSADGAGSLGNGINCKIADFPIFLQIENDTWLEAADEAVQMWNELAGETLFLVYKDEIKDIQFTVEVTETNEFIDLLGETNWDCHNNVKTFAMIKMASDINSSQEYKAVLAHETGHVLGLNHTDYGIMQSTIPLDNLSENIYLMQDYFDSLY